MQNPIPLTRDLVLVGGGHTHALVLRRWGMKPVPGVRLTVINPGPTAPYSGMLPGFVAGHYSRDQLDIDLVRLARFAGARLIDSRAVHLDRDRGLIAVQDRPSVAFDVASLDVGITSDLPALKGFSQFAVPAKPLGVFATKWDAFAARPNPGPIVILGGGVAGAELAMACAHRVQSPDITLIDRGQILEEFGTKSRGTLLAALAGLGIKLRPASHVVEIAADHVVLSDGTTLPSDFTIGAAGAKPQDWLAETGLTHQNGFLTVTPDLQTSAPSVFAVGDCAHMAHAPRPKAGVFAVRQAPVLEHNLRADLTGGSRQRYDPQTDYLKLISLGGKRAMADKAGLRVAGPLLWRLKDKIDRDFMAKFEDYPAMAQPQLPAEMALGAVQAMGDKPMCGGCGAKVGAKALQSALLALPAIQRPDVVTSAGDDSAVLQFQGVQQTISTDHLRAVTEDPYLMAQIAMVHSLGDIWSMGAAPQIALSTIILPRMSPKLQAATLHEITAGAVSILQPLGADLVGGHTTLGSELTLGFTVTGLISRAITQAGAQPGDAIVLTRPIGTGVVLAGEMQSRARGADVVAVLRTMATPQAQAAAVLGPIATAMTDVTGFGLLGHLARIASASRAGAIVDAAKVPFFAGAEELSAKGVQSTLYPSNRALVPSAPDETARQRLLFDPQTCGGLLATVPYDQAEAACRAIDGAVVIGQITDGTGIELR